MQFAIFAARKTPWDIIGENFTLLAAALLAFASVVVVLFLVAGRATVKAQEWLKYLVFLVPALLLLLVGLIYPTIRTIIFSFMDAKSENFVGLDNYVWAFTIPEILVVLRNTAVWVFLVPFRLLSMFLFLLPAVVLNWSCSYDPCFSGHFVSNCRAALFRVLGHEKSVCL